MQRARMDEKGKLKSGKVRQGNTWLAKPPSLYHFCSSQGRESRGPVPSVPTKWQCSAKEASKNCVHSMCMGRKKTSASTCSMEHIYVTRAIALCSGSMTHPACLWHAYPRLRFTGALTHGKSMKKHEKAFKRKEPLCHLLPWHTLTKSGTICNSVKTGGWTAPAWPADHSWP